MKKFLLLFNLLFVVILSQGQNKSFVPDELIIEYSYTRNLAKEQLRAIVESPHATVLAYKDKPEISSLLKSVIGSYTIKDRIVTNSYTYLVIQVRTNITLDAIIKELSKQGVKASKNEIVPIDAMAITPVGDQFPNNYFQTLSGTTPVQQPENNSMDSLIAFLPPSYRNNEEEVNEKVTFVHTEIPRLTHYDLPKIDSSRSFDFFRGGIPISSANATTHGGWTSGCGFAIWDNVNQPAGYGGGMVGMTNTKRPIIQNIGDATFGYNSALISVFSWCYNACEAFPERRYVISASFGFCSLSEIAPGLASQVQVQDKILLSLSQGNSNLQQNAPTCTDPFQIVVMGSNGHGAKHPSSNYGTRSDVAFKFGLMYGTSIIDDVTIDTWNGTSASCPGFAGAMVTLWNLMPAKMASEMKAMAINRLNTTTFIAQPDNSLSKPVMRLWYLLGNQIFPVVHTYTNPIRAQITPTLNFSTLVNDIINTQINRKYYWLKGTNWIELTNGIANLDELGSGKRLIKYRWTNSQTIGSDGQNTFSEIARGIEIYNTKPIYNSAITYCISQPSFKMKLLNCPDVTSLDTLKIFQGTTEITSTYNPTDSTFTITPGGAPSVFVKVKYFKKDNIAIADSTEATITGTTTVQTLTNTISATNFTQCAGSYAVFTVSSNSTANNYLWKKNGVNVGSNTSVYTDSTLLNGNQITCTVTPLNGCWNVPSLISNTITVSIPACTDNLNNSTVGAPELVSYQNTYCDGEAYFNGSPTAPNTYPVIRYDNSSWLPKQGTIEMLVKVQNGYTWLFGNSITSATIFAVDSNGLNKSSFIVGYANGNVAFRRFNQTTQTYTDLTATGTPFRFNEWHVIAVSYGSSGTIIRVDGQTYVTNTGVNYPINNGKGFLGGANFSDGANMWGIYGFKGWVDKFRISYSQSDWQLSLANQPPTATISASSNNVCIGSSVTFTATTNAPTSNYQWKKNGANVGINSPSYTDNTLANGSTINCVITATSGCFSTPVANSNTITMTVTNPVTPSVAISATRTNPCTGENVTFTAFSTNGGSAPVYQWKKNGINVAVGISYSTNSLLNNDVISCTMTTSLTCVTSTTANSNSLTMTVRPILTPTANITATSTNICANTQVIFNAITNISNATYQWKLNGTNVGTNSNQFISTSLSNSDAVNCIVSAPATDCYTVYTVASNSITLQVRPLLTPTIVINSNDADNILCEGQVVGFTATITNGGTNPIYQWKKNGVNIGSNSSFLQLSAPVNNDEISCTITSSETCLTGNNIESKKISLEVVQVNPVITKIGYTLNASPVRSGATWQWYKDGQVIAGESGSTYIATSFGNYTVRETYNSCGKTSASVNISPFNSNNNDEIRIYPNPTNGFLYAQTKSMDITIKSIRIYDETGKLLLLKQFSNVNLVQVDVTMLSNSMYMAVFETNKRNVTMKFIRQ